MANTITNTITNKAELEAKVQELRQYRAMQEEAEAIKKQIEAEITAYMIENELEETHTDTAKITYKSQERKALDKEKLEETFGDLTEYMKTTVYNILRIK